jgi:hypothetical protein
MKQWVFPGVGLVLAIGFGLGWLGRGSVSAPAPVSSAPLHAPGKRPAGPKVPATVAPSPAQSGVLPSPHAESPESHELPADEITAAEERSDTLEQLRASGRDQRNLLGTVLSNFQDWNAALRGDPKLDVELGSWACFRDGCFVDAVHASSASVSQSTRLITETKSFLRWNSGKMRSGEVVRPDGKVEVTWVLFAPPEGQPVMQAPPSGEET